MLHIVTGAVPARGFDFARERKNKDNYFTFHLKFIIRGKERQVNDR